jgi:ABC-type polysaccharide/polyol phosphate transport system ATPase subunit
MKDLIRKILREEVEKNTNIERYLNPLKKYIAMRSLPDFVCFSTVIESEHAIIVLFHYSRLVDNDFENKINSEIKKVFNTNDIIVTGFFGKETNCKENLERLLKNDDYNKKFFLIPNKNYNP